MSVTRQAWQWHRWLAYGVGIQLLLWVTSGLLFAWLPFKTWVKGEDLLNRVPVVLPSQWHALPAELIAVQATGVRAAQLLATPRGTVWRVALQGETLPRLIPADGSPWVAPDSQSVREFAIAHYAGRAKAVGVEWLEDVPRRLGIVDEAGGRAPVWRVHFDDSLSTRIYFDGHSGALLALRTEAWVWYDFFWRLHIMDYLGGEDFNNTLLRAAATAAWFMAVAGSILTLLALRRVWRRRRARTAGG